MSETSQYNLDKPAAELVAYLSQGPALYELPLADVRQAVDGAQAGAPMPDVEEAWVTVPAEVGDVRVLIITPRGAEAQLPVVLYMHGGGWILGSALSHGRLAGELAVAADAAVAFIDYALALKPDTPCKSSSATPSLGGSPSKAKATGSTRRVSRSRVTQPEATWRRCFASWRSSVAT